VFAGPVFPSFLLLLLSLLLSLSGPLSLPPCLPASRSRSRVWALSLPFHPSLAQSLALSASLSPSLHANTHTHTHTHTTNTHTQVEANGRFASKSHVSNEGEKRATKAGSEGARNREPPTPPRTHFTCFTSTKVQILTPPAWSAEGEDAVHIRCRRDTQDCRWSADELPESSPHEYSIHSSRHLS
jgi:hypothetical protein